MGHQKENFSVILCVSQLSLSEDILYLIPCFQWKNKKLFPDKDRWNILLFQFSSVQSLRRVWLFVTPWTAARQDSLSITNSRSPPKPMSIESVMPSNHLILCRPLLPPSIFPSIRVFSNESARHIRWPKYWRFSFKVNPTNDHPGLISLRMDWLDLAVQGTVESSPTFAL